VLFRSTMSNTYETTRALRSTCHQPDKIIWDASQSVRDSPYRLLHHQQGIIGTFQVQLLEAAALQRSYWSALALGPVKHLGLSKAHGKVSSFVVLSLNQQATSSFQSPVVPCNDDPVWHACQGSLPLRKGLQDGAAVQLTVRVMEDSTPAEGFVPLMAPSDQDRWLGVGQLDVTELCLGLNKDGDMHVGIIDAWIPIHKTDSAASEKETGRVRVLVSYQPNGIQPQHNDLVALEAFARLARDSSIGPVLPPLQPMRVLQTRGSFILVEYHLPHDSHDIRSNKATMRLHRNAVFTIEHSTFIDAAVNIALLPADMILATPLGQHTARVATPILQSAGDVLLPALLSVRLVFLALKTTGMAALTGISAATQAVVAQSQQQHQQRQQQQSFSGTLRERL